jgi:hypothetical protein
MKARISFLSFLLAGLGVARLCTPGTLVFLTSTR